MGVWNLLSKWRSLGARILDGLLKSFDSCSCFGYFDGSQVAPRVGFWRCSRRSTHTTGESQMKLLSAFWKDESGAILSAEAALLGTVGIVGGVVGLSAVSSSLNEELKDVAFAFRSLDQSYSFEGHRSARAWSAGSGFTQKPVKEAHEELQRQIDEHEEALRRESEGAGGAASEEEVGQTVSAESHGSSGRVFSEKQVVDSSWQIDGPVLPAPAPRD